MTTHKAHPRPRIESIRTQLLTGAPLLLLPGGVLVRWPSRARLPKLGDEFKGSAVRVPEHLQDAVETVLFGECPVERCDAAKLLARNKVHRKSILLRLYSRPHVQQMLVIAERLPVETRARLRASGVSMPIRKLLDIVYAVSQDESADQRPQK